MKHYDLAVAILARPSSLVETEDPQAQLSALAPSLLALAVGGAALFGLAVGAFHGGWQLLYAAVKLPLVLLIPIAVTWPALRIGLASRAEPVDGARAALAALVGMARVGALCTAVAPALWLTLSLRPPYPVALSIMCGCLVLAGTPGLTAIARGLGRGRLQLRAGVLTVALVGGVLAQTGWMLRPFVVAPEAQLTFLCPVSHDVVTGLLARVAGDSELYAGPQPLDCAAAPQ